MTSNRARAASTSATESNSLVVSDLTVASTVEAVEECGGPLPQITLTSASTSTTPPPPPVLTTGVNRHQLATSSPSIIRILNYTPTRLFVSQSLDLWISEQGPRRTWGLARYSRPGFPKHTTKHARQLLQRVPVPPRVPMPIPVHPTLPWTVVVPNFSLYGTASCICKRPNTYLRLMHSIYTLPRTI
ncbi:hypothetical protein LIA77_07457 [Sarocladium implicatum]|nr:hypothetical protein LIA77_07457 [Sarocladium implicatum]